MGWWNNFVRGGSPWSNPVLENRHVDAASFQAPFLRALESLVRSHPEVFLREMKSIFSRLMTLPDFDSSWPHSISSLSRMLNAIRFSVKKFERLAQELCAQAAELHSRRYSNVPDRCIVVADETHIDGGAMVRPRGWGPVGDKVEILAPDPRPRTRFLSIVAVSYTRGVLDLAIHETPPAQVGDDWLAFCTSLAMRMNAYVPGVPWDVQLDDCVFLYDNAGVHIQAADQLLAINGVRRMRLPPYCPHLSSIEPTFADYKAKVRDLAFGHPDLPDRMLHVLAWASVPPAAIRGHYHEARRQSLRQLPELTGPGGPLEGVFRPLPVVRTAP